MRNPVSVSSLYSSFIVHRSSFIIHRSSFIVHRSSFIVHHSSFIIHRSSFIVHHSSFIIHRSSFIVHHSSLNCLVSARLSSPACLLVRAYTTGTERELLHCDHRG